MPVLRLLSLVISFSRSLACRTSGLPFGMFPVLARSHMWQAHYSLDRKSCGFGAGAWGSISCYFRSSRPLAFTNWTPYHRVNARAYEYVLS
jgi:hypothetical protein